MEKSRFSDSHILGMLKKAEGGVLVCHFLKG